MEFFRGFNEIVFPSRCISCSILGFSLCAQCLSIWSYQTFSQKLSQESNEKLLVFSSISYSPIARDILLAAKESNVVQAGTLIIDALENTLQKFIEQHPSLSISGLVPIPSRPQANRVRGRDFMQTITQSLAKKFQIPMLPILGYSRRVKDQSGLNSEERRNNLTDSLVVRGNVFKSENQAVLLIDDLVTTGATLLAAQKALNQAGIRAIGAVTACVAQPLRYGGGRAPF
jgi:predicted amidophosphoribosyltransferase